MSTPENSEYSGATNPEQAVLLRTLDLSNWVTTAFKNELNKVISNGYTVKSELDRSIVASLMNGETRAVKSNNEVYRARFVKLAVIHGN